MKKSALILKWFIIVFSLRLIYLICRQIWFVIQSYGTDSIEKDVFFGIKTPEDLSYTGYLLVSVFCCAILIYLLFILNLFRRVVQDLVINQIFISKNAEQLVKIGKRLFIFGIILVLIQLALRTSPVIAVFLKNDVPYSMGYMMGYSLGFFIKFLFSTGFPIFISALFLFIIAKLINEGHLLKQENDLTV